MRIFTYKCYHQNQLIKTTTSWQEAKEWERSEALNYFLIDSADEREMLISGVRPTCWNDNFSDEEEDEDFEPDYDECGFNPYMGCYDYDC